MAKFRVIIIGGGPVGLSMAHCLRLAGIDYVLCEQRPTIEDRQGAALSVMPHISRLFEQFGLVAQAEKHGASLQTTAHFMDDHSKGWRDDGFGRLETSFGYPVRLFERYRLIKVLLEALPDREKRVKTGRRLQAIREHAHGVTVEFADGTVEAGSIVVGADGVHSGVRRLLSELHPGAVDADPFTSLYWGLYGHGPVHPAVRQGETAEFHHDGWAFQLLTARDRTFYFVYCRLDTPTKERRRFTETDALEFSKPYLDEHVFNGVTFRDIWDTRDLGSLRLLEQGISKTWSRGRVVLVGDAVHKVTPNLGVGGNIGMESAACLANHLHALLQQQPDPDTASLAQAFQEYQDQRMEAVRFWDQAGHRHMQFLTLDTPQHRAVFESRVPPCGLDRTLPVSFPRAYMGHIRDAVKLDYVPLEPEHGGSVPWASGAHTKDKALPQSKL